MKIISLHFKNLSSLKGEFKIDFTTPALANAGLFAITGPTGAGKSTILDAITLALYSYTPRLGGINKNSITEKGIIVTKHTKEAFAHLVFEVDNFKYKAEWAIAITSKGNWGNITHKLSKEEGGAFVSITQNTSGTVDMVNEVIGIDKDQFTKAIVLSQGKFDEFLTAKEGDRYENNVAIFKAHKTWNETKQPLAAYASSLSTYDNEKENLKKLKEERDSLFALSSIADYKNEITLKWTGINRDINDATNVISRATIDKQEKQTEYDTVDARLSLAVLQNAFSNSAK